MTLTSVIMISPVVLMLLFAIFTLIPNQKRHDELFKEVCEIRKRKRNKDLDVDVNNL